MPATPFIRQVRQSGGTLYIFNSSTEDLNFLINESDERGFKWSKFVLLDIPDELRPTNRRENYIQYDAIPGAFENTLNKTPENKLAESFQNYCMNIETLLTQDSRYDEELKRTVSERVFFKWLKELGALRFRQATTTEASANTDGARFVEEDRTQDNDYRRVVQYIGDIDMVNSNKFQTTSYSEVYVHVPISHGNTPRVLFNTIPDNNYRQNTVYQYNPANPANAPYLVGRAPQDTHPMGLSTLAFYDSKANTFDPSGYTLRREVINPDGTRTFVNGWYYDNPISNSYITSRNFSDQQNDRLRITGKGPYIGRNLNVLRSRLDGISLDFEEENYYGIVTNPGINSFSQYNQANNSQPFQFNAVLIYYDVFEKPTPENKESNLLGVLFLNKPVARSAGGSTMPRLSKFKPNPITGDNGNAWGLKVNLKLDVSASDTQIETVVNEYNTYSMELFLEAMSELKRTGDSLDTINTQFIKFKDKVNELEDYTFRKQNIAELWTKYEELQQTIESNFEVFNSNTELVNLINQAFVEINNIYNDRTSIDVAYNLDVLDNGFGIRMDRINKKKKISTNLQEYFIRRNPVFSIPNDFSISSNRHELIIPNIEYTQLLRIEEPGFNRYQGAYNLSRNVRIYIDDTFIQWRNGQKLRVSFGNNYISSSNIPINLDFYTDAVDRKNTGSPYNVLMNLGFPITDLIFRFKRIQQSGVERFIPPVIEITCIDEQELIFIIEIL